MSHPVKGQITHMDGIETVYTATLEHLNKKGGIHPPQEKASIGIQPTNTQV